MRRTAVDGLVPAGSRDQVRDGRQRLVPQQFGREVGLDECGGNEEVEVGHARRVYRQSPAPSRVRSSPVAMANCAPPPAAPPCTEPRAGARIVQEHHPSVNPPFRMAGRPALHAAASGVAKSTPGQVRRRLRVVHRRDLDGRHRARRGGADRRAVRHERLPEGKCATGCCRCSRTSRSTTPTPAWPTGRRWPSRRSRCPKCARPRRTCRARRWSTRTASRAAS